MLYVVRSGSFKTFQRIKDNEHITSFHFPGEALETASVCEISFDDLLQLSAKIPSLQKRLLALACKREDNHTLFTLTCSAIERVSALLLNLSSRFKNRDLSATQFNLSMARQDIAKYLGLTNETTRRMFNQIAKEKAISIKNRQIEILDTEKLKEYTLLS